MIPIKSLVQAFSALGEVLRSLADTEKTVSSQEEAKFRQLVESCVNLNKWFEPDHVRRALINIGLTLTEEKLTDWLSSYSPAIECKRKSRRILVIHAGNIPAVGFSDLMHVIFSNNHYLGKLSSDDTLILPAIAKTLIAELPELSNQISFTEDIVRDFDAVIATGSNNTSRYFEYYFGKYPHIIRKNRNGTAILTGNESRKDLQSLGDDVFLYFGLGCRSISKLFIPKEYNFEGLFQAFESFRPVALNSKYVNNYEYYKSIYLLNGVRHSDNGFLLLKPDTGFSSPPAVVYYEEYENRKGLIRLLDSNSGKIQCIAGNVAGIKGIIPFGTAQQPHLTDYADGVDTMDFLLKLG